MPRVGKHFKIHASIQNHRTTLGVFDDDALLAMYVRAGILAVERFADRTGDSFLVSAMDLERLAGCRGVANARRKLGRLEAATRLKVGQEGAGYRLTFPNFALKQGFGSRKEQAKGNPSSSSSTPTSTTYTRENASRSDPPNPKKRKPKTKEPDPRAVEAWPDIREAFTEYGRSLGESVGFDRAALIAKRLDEGATAVDLVSAVHGYVRGHGGLEARDNFDPGQYFRPQTIFKAEGFSDRVDLGKGPRRTTTKLDRMVRRMGG